MKMKSKLRTVLLFCVATSLAAGSSLYSQGREAVRISVRALVLEGKSDLSERYIQTKEEHKLLTLSTRQPGKPIKTLTKGNLILYREVEDELGKKSYLPTEQIPIPPEARDILLLTWKTPNGQRYYPIDDKLSESTHDDWLMINTTSRAIGFRIGEDDKEPLFLEPNKIGSYRVETTIGVGIPVLGRTKRDDKIITFYSTYWPIQKNERSIVIFTEQNGKIRVKKIVDKLLRNEDTKSTDS